MHFCSSFKGFEAVPQGKLDVTGKSEKFLQSLEFSFTGQLELEKFFAWPLSDFMKELVSISLFYIFSRTQET